ncbi:MAG: hypothetical protein QOG53_1977 [Frankiales bacterium]|nr:hypothetical protein [Frankiales bacterium]
MGKSEYDDNPPAAGPSDSPGQQANEMALGKDEEERRKDRSFGGIGQHDYALQEGHESEPDPDSRGPDKKSDAPSSDD